MRVFRLISALALLASLTIVPAAASDPNEQYALDLPSADGARESSQHINTEMHYAGTAGDYHMATWMRDQLANEGFDASLETFTGEVPQLVAKPVLQIYTRPRIDFDLHEVKIAQDPDGSRPDAEIPFNAWSGNGDVTATVVDAGRGTQADYDALKAAGVDVHAHIVVVRYGAEFRGLLADRAEREGAAGIVFFSDANGRDGSNRGIPYPDGPYRPVGSVQRGSLGTRKRIPALPVRADIASRLLQSVRDHVGTELVHLRVIQRAPQTTMWNTVGILRGTDPSHSIVLGAHRDAWVYGVTDNGSGISTLLETGRALGYLYRSGWRPRFNIVVVGFDGEEIGEAGSIAYVRGHLGELQGGCIAYINSDEATTGQLFDVDAVAALHDVFAAAAQRVPDPHAPKQSLYERWKHQHDGISVGTPGGGSDFEAFLYDAGVPVMEAHFDGVFGVYHSAYDDLRYAATQADPGFINHRALAQLMAISVLRLANGTLQYRLIPYADEMSAAVGRMRASNQLSPLDAGRMNEAIARYRTAATYAERHGIDGNREIAAVHRLNRLFYGRIGYASVLFPDIAAAAAAGGSSGDPVARTVAELDAVSAMVRNS